MTVMRSRTSAAHVPSALRLDVTLQPRKEALRGPVVLSAMEEQILRHLADGMQSKEIAVLVRRKKPTIEGYIRTLFVKLGAKSRPHLVSLAHRNGLL
jgi:LuxR family transcriptional regulator, quorum-sensing system regulator SdiA